MEMTWNTVLIIFEVIALSALSVLCVYLIGVVVRLRSVLTIVEDDIRELDRKSVV